jgi:hypothetical protein
MSDFRINDLELVSLTVASWNLIGEFLRRLDVTEKTGLIAVSCTLACALLVCTTRSVRGRTDFA